MLRCFYTWEEYDRGKGEYIRNQCSEEICEGSEKYCIFHELSKEKDIGLFKQKLKKKLDTGDYNFRGYCFPIDADFSDAGFGKNVYFNGATFQENVYFNGATFQEKVEFNGATFQGTFFGGATFQDASFNRATFKNASFDEVTFQNTTFTGATFQDVSFEKTAFQEDADFKGAIFQNVSFYGAIFQNVSFNETKFRKNVYFRRAIFQKNVSFNKTKFKNASFDETTFQKNVSFNKAIIGRNLEFNPKEKQIKELNLQNTQFLLKGSVTADLTKAKFHRVALENVAFIDCKWPKKIHEETNMEDENLSFKELETIYRNLKQNMQRHGDYSKAGDFHYREMECRKKAMREKRSSLNWFKSFGYSILKYTCGYGEKPERVIGVSLLIVLVVALFFMYNGIAMGENTSEERVINYDLPLSLPSSQAIKDFEQCLYCSFVTFTTLGYGDIHPIGFSKVVACVESFSGAFFIALFVVVFVRKMMR